MYIYGWTVKVHFSVECIKLMISAFESLAFHSLSAWDWRFPQPIEMLTLRTMVGGLQMTNNELKRYIDEVRTWRKRRDERRDRRAENRQPETQGAEPETLGAEPETQGAEPELRSRINRRPNFTG